MAGASDWLLLNVFQAGGSTQWQHAVAAEQVRSLTAGLQRDGSQSAGTEMGGLRNGVRLHWEENDTGN